MFHAVCGGSLINSCESWNQNQSEDDDTPRKISTEVTEQTLRWNIFSDNLCQATEETTGTKVQENIQAKTIPGVGECKIQNNYKYNIITSTHAKNYTIPTKKE